jgi:hypothetical protein
MALIHLDDIERDRFSTKQWRLMVGCALMGLLVTVFIALYIFLAPEFDASLYHVFAVICPPALLLIPLSEVMNNLAVFCTIWSVIALANSGLYGIVGAVAAGQLWAPD